MTTTIAGTAAAWAEGSWSSYMKDWRNGKESRRWTDNHTDRNPTTIGLSGCDFGGSGGVNLHMYRVVNNWPDASHEMKSPACETVSWGEMKTKGQYYFRYEGNHVINVRSVVVKY